MTNTRSTAWLCVSVLALWAGGCESADPSAKEQARQHDGLTASGEDACAVTYWYGDGECDPWCVHGDPDCYGPGADGGVLPDETQCTNITCGEGTRCCPGCPEDGPTCVDENMSCGLLQCSPPEEPIECANQACPPTMYCCPGCEDGADICVPAGSSCPYLQCPPPSKCDAQDAVGTGACARAFGVVWDGHACTTLSGCECEGSDCAALYDSLKQCEAAHASCIDGRTCNSNNDCGKDSFCDFAGSNACSGEGACKPSPHYCYEILAPVCGCDGETYSNDCYAARAGVNILYEGDCRL